MSSATATNMPLAGVLSPTVVTTVIYGALETCLAHPDEKQCDSHRRHENVHDEK